MMKKRTLYGWLMLVVTGILTGCSQETQVTEITGNSDTKVQQVRFYVSSGHIEDAPLTRDVPPVSGGETTIPGTCQVDRIALLTFKRQVDTDNPFLFDQVNSVVFDADGKISTTNNIMELECEDYPDAPVYPSETSYYQKQAIGKITKQKGYEYKVIALGYNTARKDNYPTGNNPFDERSCFQIVAGDGRGIDESTSLSEVKLKLIPLDYSAISADLAGSIKDQITGAWLRTPELFFANCSIAGDEDGIIQFADTREITGVLKRGVAQVNLNIEKLQGVISLAGRKAMQFSFLADVLNTEVCLENYDCFLQPSAPQGLYSSEYTGKFTALTGTTDCKDLSTIAFSVYVLPTVTSLRVRYMTAYDVITDPVERVFDSDIAVTSQSDGNQATGIIDPAGGGKTFYLRRNHRYTIKGTGEQIAENDQ